MKSFYSGGQSCRDNPNVPCLCLLSSTSGNYGTRIRTHHPTRTSYSECLDKHLAGRQFQSKCTAPQTAQTPRTISSKGCCGDEYVDIHGQTRPINFSKPYALMIYTPRPHERYFQTKERAVLEAPRCGGAEWQIIHLPSGQIIYEPKRKGC